MPNPTDFHPDATEEFKKHFKGYQKRVYYSARIHAEQMGNSEVQIGDVKQAIQFLKYDDAGQTNQLRMQLVGGAALGVGFSLLVELFKPSGEWNPLAIIAGIVFVISATLLIRLGTSRNRLL